MTTYDDNDFIKVLPLYKVYCFVIISGYKILLITKGFAYFIKQQFSDNAYLQVLVLNEI